MPLIVDSTNERQGFTDLHCTLAPRTAPDEADTGPVDPDRVRDRCPGPLSGTVLCRIHLYEIKTPSSAGRAPCGVGAPSSGYREARDDSTVPESPEIRGMYQLCQTMSGVT